MVTPSGSQLVIGARTRRTAFPITNGSARKRLHARLGQALHAREEPVGACVAQRTLVPKGDAGHGPHVGTRGRTVALKHLVERSLEERQILVGEARSVRPAREVGVDVAVYAIEGVRHGELPAHRAIVALLSLSLAFGRDGASRDGVFLSDDRME